MYGPSVTAKFTTGSVVGYTIECTGGVTKRMRTKALFTISAAAARLAGLVILSLLMLGTAFAQDADPPDRVARLSFLQGAVSLQPAGEQDWVTAELNRPLTTNDRVWSDAPGSRAELDLGGAVVRLGSQTGFSFLNLDNNSAQMQVSSGTVEVRVRELFENEAYEIDTPNVAVLLEQPGQYRVDVNETGDTTVVRVNAGQAEASGGGQDIPISNQEMVSFFGTDQLSVVPASLGARDGFDDWSYERDRELEGQASRRYVADDMVGTEDLDDNGQWQDTPDYGDVWVPTTVAVGWAPYSFGHWAWVSPWGWTWIDDAPWGFAPFHYGRWARWHNSWCWVPGPRQLHSVYAPALVAWAGGVGGAGVAWFPLAPREVYVPGYHVSAKYVQSINVANTNITDHAYIENVYQNRVAGIRYANSAVPGAVTSVSRGVFTGAQPVNTHRSVLSAAQVTQLAPTARAPMIAPVRQSVLGSSVSGLVRRPPATVLNHPVVARNVPPAATGVRVRLVGSQGRPISPGANTQQASAPGFNRPGSAAVPQPRPNIMPQQGTGEVDNRSWAERAHALEHNSFPAASRSSQPPPAYRDDNTSRDGGVAVREYNEQNYRPGGVTPQELSGESREERSSAGSTGSQNERVEQNRAPVNTYIRPAPAPSQNEEERRFTTPAPAPSSQRPPETHFTAPVPKPPPAPVRPSTAPPQQHSSSGNHGEERNPPRGPVRGADPH